MWYQNKLKIKDNIYISCFITYNITSEQLNLLNECVKELYKNHKLNTKILNLIHLLDYHRFIDGVAFDKGLYLYKHYLNYEIWLAKEVNDTHNLPQKVLDKFKINYKPYKHIMSLNDSFAFDGYIVPYIDNGTLRKISNDLENKFIFFNKQQDFKNAVYSMLEIEHIIFFDENYIREIADDVKKLQGGTNNEKS